MAFRSESGGSVESPRTSDQQMCVIERTDGRINPLNMTLAARLHVPSKFRGYVLKFYNYKVCK